jgi:hypothetical protein
MNFEIDIYLLRCGPSLLEKQLYQIYIGFRKFTVDSLMKSATLCSYLSAPRDRNFKAFLVLISHWFVLGEIHVVMVQGKTKILFRRDYF